MSASARVPARSSIEILADWSLVMDGLDADVMKQKFRACVRSFLDKARRGEVIDFALGMGPEPVSELTRLVGPR